MENLTIKDGTKRLKDKAFFGNTSISTVFIPDSVTRIGEMAFYFCIHLEHVILPSRLEEIENYTFYDCHELKSIKFPSSLKSIGKSAFHACRLLESLELPDGLEEIQDGAFEGCKSLKYIKIPASIQSVGTLMKDLRYCAHLEDIVCPISLASDFKYILPKAKITICGGTMPDTDEQPICIPAEENDIQACNGNFDLKSEDFNLLISKYKTHYSQSDEKEQMITHLYDLVGVDARRAELFIRTVGASNNYSKMLVRRHILRSFFRFIISVFALILGLFLASYWGIFAFMALGGLIASINTLFSFFDALRTRKQSSPDFSYTYATSRKVGGLRQFYTKSGKDTL